MSNNGKVTCDNCGNVFNFIFSIKKVYDSEIGENFNFYNCSSEGHPTCPTCGMTSNGETIREIPEKKIPLKYRKWSRKRLIKLHDDNGNFAWTARLKNIDTEKEYSYIKKASGILQYARRFEKPKLTKKQYDLLMLFQ